MNNGRDKGNAARFNNSDLTILSDGQRIHSFPYKINGLLTGIIFGLNLDRPWKKGHQ